MSVIRPSFNLTDLDERARRVFADIVNAYLETGQPIGSKTLSLSNEQQLSPATIRNTMADLARSGLLSASHSSAGRIPTQMGLRMFVDGFLQIGDVSQRERKQLESQMAAEGKSQDKIFEQASSLLSGLAGGAGLVLTPSPVGSAEDAVKHVDFVNVDENRVLVIIVYAGGQVENRIMVRPSGLPPASLERAGQFLSMRLKGRRLSDTRTDILAEIKSGEAEIDKSAAGLIEKGLATWSNSSPGRRRSLIVRGQSHLLENLEMQADLERIRQLFDDLERKEDLIALLDQAETADGVKIFIGSENPLFSLSDSSVVIAPYRNSEKTIIGAIGVIGPTRINYARIIPMVDYTAQIVGRMLDEIKV